jgi:hypothetical protein
MTAVVVATAALASAQAPNPDVAALASRSMDERRMAVRRLAVAAPNAGSDVRSEIFQELKQLDERATAALIEARADPSPEVRDWAKDVLDALGRRTPGDAVQTANDQVLIDVLRAYASIRDADALPVVLAFVNSDRAQVRAAAREATLAYGVDAMGKLRATYAALTGQRPAEDADVVTVAHELFAAYDRHRLRDVYARLEQGLSKVRAGDLDDAIVDFDNVLARQPLLDRGPEIVPAYVAYAEALEPSNTVRAIDYLHRALRLDDQGPQSNHVRGELLYLKGEDLLSRGIPDTQPFEEALALDPANAHARTELERLRVDAERRRKREVGLAALIAALGGGLLTAGVIALLRRRAASSP